jgi:four helix bundle protein
MKFEKFEDIFAWQKAQELALEMYKCFHGLNDFGFRDQILRAVVSISNNIAEDFERKGNKEFKYFLFVAKGSSADVRSMLYLAKDLNYIKNEKSERYVEATLSISKMISGLIKVL